MSDPIISVAGFDLSLREPIEVSAGASRRSAPVRDKKKMASASGEYERGCAAGRAWRARNPGVTFVPTEINPADYSRGFNECANQPQPPKLMPTEPLKIQLATKGEESTVSGFDLAYRG